MEKNQRPPDARPRLIVIGGSAGGLEAVGSILRELPADFPAAIFVVIHLDPRATSNLPAIFARMSHLRVRHPINGDRIEPGVVYVAPPDRHMVIRDSSVALTSGPRENRVRPAVDVLFRSAAAFGSRVVGIIVSGGLGDGALGMAAIAASGGTTIVQQPSEAVSRGMPESAIDQVAVDHVLPVADIPALLQHLVDSDAEAAVDPPPPGGWDTGSYGVTCPECHGILHERDDNGVPVFVCRVGHRFSEESLVEAQSVGVEAALWIAVRALEERADFAQRLSRRFDSRGNQHASERMAREAHDVALQAEVVRRLLKGEYLGGDPVEPAGDE